MERKPLLDEKTAYDSTEDSTKSETKRPPFQTSKSYDQLPSSITSYFGENYHCVITPPRGLPNDEQESLIDNSGGSESSTNSQIGFETPKKHRPLFICLVSFIDIVILVYSCIVGKVESIGLVSHYQSKQVPRFGDIHKIKGNQTFEHFGIYPGQNIFIGPNVSFLVRLGALYPPCMREDKGIRTRINNQKESEKAFICCSLNKECSMMDNKSCLSLFGKSVGNTTMCSSPGIHCKNSVTLRPCCVGVHAKCLIISEKKCQILKGTWHSDKVLCSDVNCLDGICGMTGAHQTYGQQFYRIITPVFLHIGILHLLTNLAFQIVVGCKIEIEIGTISTAVIYLVSGLGGNLFSGIFTPLMPQVGASGALFGLMAIILVYYVQNYNRLRRPFVDLCIIISVILFSFALGTIPYIGNFVHLGGFIFGLLATIVVSKRIAYNGAQTQASFRHRIWKVVCFVSLILLIVSSFTIFYTFEDDFCPKCKYVDCIPYTKTFCPDMSSDGILNADYENS